MWYSLDYKDSWFIQYLTCSFKVNECQRNVPKIKFPSDSFLKTAEKKEAETVNEKSQTQGTLGLAGSGNTRELSVPHTCPNTYRGAEKSEQDSYPGCSPDWLLCCTLDSHLVEEYDYTGLAQSISSIKRGRKPKTEFAFLRFWLLFFFLKNWSIT